MVFVGAAISDSRLTGGNLQSFNELVDEGIPMIVRDLFGVDITTKNHLATGANKDIDHFRIVVKFLDAKVHRPVKASYP